MKRNKAARRYAKALFGLGRETDRLEVLHDDVVALQSLLRASEAFHAFAENPLIPRDRRRASLKALFENRLDTVTLTFLLFIDEKDRLGLLPGICEAFERLYDDWNGNLKVTVVSARPLKDDQLARLCERLRARLQKNIVPVTRVAPALLGGFRVHAGDQVFDASIATQLVRLKQKLIHA